MHTRGTFAPETRADALETYEEVGPVAQVVVREATKAMEFDADEYDERVTPEVIRTARDAVFAELLAVHVGDEAEFDAWLADSEFDADDVVRIGSDNVEIFTSPDDDTVVLTDSSDRAEVSVDLDDHVTYGNLSTGDRLSVTFTTASGATTTSEIRVPTTLTSDQTSVRL
jgi:hypothetical protein